MTCSQCGVCCNLFLINLSEEEYKSGRYQTMFDEFVHDAEESKILGTHEMSFEEAEMVGANILKQKENKACIYLKNNKCSIHSFRPKACKNFFCSSEEEKFKKMIKTIKEYKDAQSSKTSK